MFWRCNHTVPLGTFGIPLVLVQATRLILPLWSLILTLESSQILKASAMANIGTEDDNLIQIPRSYCILAAVTFAQTRAQIRHAP